jgi:hypothetical protein
MKTYRYSKQRYYQVLEGSNLPVRVMGVAIRHLTTRTCTLMRVTRLLEELKTQYHIVVKKKDAKELWKLGICSCEQ